MRQALPIFRQGGRDFPSSATAAGRVSNAAAAVSNTANHAASNTQALALGTAQTLPGLLSPNYSNMKGMEDAAAQARIQWFDYLRQIGIQVGEANATLAWDRAVENRILGDNSPENLRLGQLIYEGYTPEEAEAIVQSEHLHQHLTATASAATTALGNTASSYLMGNLRSLYNEAVQNYIQTGSVDTPDSGWYDDTESDEAEIRSAENNLPDVDLRFRTDWTDEQRQQAMEKLEAESRAYTWKHPTERVIRNPRKLFLETYGPDSIPEGYDIDHKIDLQLGGADDISNMWAIDRSVNRSLGIQIYHQIKNYPEDTVFGEFHIS